MEGQALDVISLSSWLWTWGNDVSDLNWMISTVDKKHWQQNEQNKNTPDLHLDKTREVFNMHCQRLQLFFRLSFSIFIFDKGQVARINTNNLDVLVLVWWEKGWYRERGGGGGRDMQNKGKLPPKSPIPEETLTPIAGQEQSKWVQLYPLPPLLPSSPRQT